MTDDTLHAHPAVTADQPAPPVQDPERRWATAVGIRVRAARIVAGLSTEQLAQRTWSTPGRLRVLEGGRSNDLLLHIRTARVLNQDVGRLLAGHPSGPDDAEGAWQAQVGQRYRTARETAGQTLEQLARQAGATPGKLRALEDGRSTDLRLHIRAALLLTTTSAASTTAGSANRSAACARRCARPRRWRRRCCGSTRSRRPSPRRRRSRPMAGCRSACSAAC